MLLDVYKLHGVMVRMKRLVNYNNIITMILCFEKSSNES